jgi:hypothetical protein
LATVHFKLHQVFVAEIFEGALGSAGFWKGVVWRLEFRFIT